VKKTNFLRKNNPNWQFDLELVIWWNPIFDAIAAVLVRLYSMWCVSILGPRHVASGWRNRLMIPAPACREERITVFCPRPLIKNVAYPKYHPAMRYACGGGHLLQVFDLPFSPQRGATGG
jgi:hypothetical protein